MAKSSSKVDAFVLSLATGASVAASGKSVGWSLRTSYRRAATTDIRQRVDEVRGRMWREAAGRLAGAATLAVETLVKLCEAAESEMARLGASRELLAVGMRLNELLDLEKRIAALEQRSDMEVRADGGPTILTSTPAVG